MHKMGSVKKFSSETNMHKVECERKSQRYDGEKNQLHRIRYMTAQKYEEALNLMQSGASIQLRHGQVTCGAELALLFVETLIKAKIPYTREALDRIGTIFSEFPQLAVPHKLLEEDDLRKLSEILVAAKARVDGCSSFLKAAIKWSAAYGGPSKGAAELHDMLAQYISSQSPELDFAKASKYFVNGSHPKAFAVALVDFSEKSYIGEADLAIARGILMYLVSGDLRDANCLMDELREQSTLKEIVLPSTPLLQFVEYLLLTLERDALPLFQLLRQNYKSSISRDSSFNELLDEIAERFYGVRRRSGLQSILGDMFKMMEN
ncbi:protein GET4 isoform X1 [Cryptomeria japonica]|uniref:protein GET4 isoform X1 n=1 Tax=Cryptomeria japonica TaxID=3369 RepID=UPI0027DA52B9|nr:protein GET4 isoform X1 [Cryptomeria japonica]